jgi:hypothetical protein
MTAPAAPAAAAETALRRRIHALSRLLGTGQ